MPDWKNINSAPRDGTIILLFVPGDGLWTGVFTGWSDGGAWYTGLPDCIDGDATLSPEPTMWAPRPAPPSEAI